MSVPRASRRPPYPPLGITRPDGPEPDDHGLAALAEQLHTALDDLLCRTFESDDAPAHHDMPEAWWVRQAAAILSDDMEFRPRPPAPDSLDAAWAEAEAALPNGDKHRGHPLWRFGSWRMKVIGPWDIEHDGYRPTWQAIADPYNEGMSQDPRGRSIECLGPTPAAALRALTAKLRERTP